MLVLSSLWKPIERVDVTLPSRGTCAQDKVLLVTALSILLGVADATAGSTTLPDKVRCLENLDLAVSIGRDGDLAKSRKQFERLATQCPGLPQAHHNLGVIALREGGREQAIEHLEAALETEARTAETLGALRAMHRHAASLAYARALGTASTAPSPTLDWQDASDQPEGLEDASSDELRDLVTLEYELYDWWQGAASDPAEGWLAHYSDDYPRRVALADHGRPRPADWSDVRREIAFTENDAVAIIEHAGDTRLERRLLLLRLYGHRWKIYQETPW